MFGEARGAVETKPIPCGKCLLCRKAQSLEWFVRLYCESFLHERACAVTLTYRDEDLPRAGEWTPRDLVLFMARLRKAEGAGIRAYMQGEYSPAKLRPHYHGLLFGYFPSDAIRSGGGGSASWRSPELERLWGLGDSLKVQECSPGTARYVAGHTVSKLLSDLPAGFGEVPSYKSRGLGRGFFERYRDQLLAHDCIRVRDSEGAYGLPRFFDKLAAQIDPLLVRDLKDRRAERAAEGDFHDPARVEARAVILDRELRSKRQSRAD